LKFCYESITRETALQDSKLEIDTIGARVICRHCNYTGAPKYWMDSLADAPVPTLQCPNCGRATEVEQGHECAIKSIQYADS
jgi:Zn finger protein HypA/HybF involved in hydrogenase expression